MRTALALTLALLLPLSAAAATKKPTAAEDERAIRQAFADWAAAYNVQDTAGALKLWHKEMLGTHGGGPEFRYVDLINGYKMTFADLVVKRTNEVIIEEVHINGDMAWVRWRFLQTEERMKAAPVKILTKCLGVLERQPDGAWQVMRWMSTPVKNR